MKKNKLRRFFVQLVVIAILCFQVDELRGALTGEVGVRPNMALFKPGETVPLIFNASGASGTTLSVTIRDIAGTQVFSNIYNVTSANWTATISGYNAKLGFYRVSGQLSNGTTIAPVGSRASLPAGSASFLTYCIVPDPALRPALSEDQAFFGLQGGFLPSVGTDIFAFLGVRWVTDGSWSWKALSPSYGTPYNGTVNPAPYVTWATNGAGGAWILYSIPNLTKDGRPYGGSPDVYKAGTFAYNTGALNSSYHSDWQTFTQKIAQYWPSVYPSRTKKYYEITWEPIIPWGYNGTAADFVTLYQLSYNSMKAQDPNAKVMGPCMHVEASSNLSAQYSFFDAGLASYIDVYSAHPYMEQDLVTNVDSFTDPELAGQPAHIQTLKRRLKAYKGGVEIPMIGTEQGYRTRQDVAKELHQARRLVRSNLIMLGEGWKINTAFYLADYPGTDNIDGNTYWDWGLFYNLDTTAYGGYGPGKISPKPVVASYAAMTYLVEGRKAVNTVNWLGDSTRGYVYESYSNPTDEMLVLWDFASTRTLTIDTGAASVDVYDWMGNKQTVVTSGGSLTVTISNEPVYIKGVSSNLWGSNRNLINVALNSTVTTSGNLNVSSSGTLAVDGDSQSYESRWVSTSDSNAKWVQVNLGGTYLISGVRFWTGQYQEGWRANLYQLPLPSYRIQRWTGSAWVDIVSRSGNTQAVINETFAPVSTSQVRLYVDAGVITQVALYELQILSTGGSSNLAAGRPVTASSSYTDPYSGATYPASYAVDGNGGTRWSSSFTNNEWIYIDLGNIYNITDVKLNWASGGHGSNYQIQVSTNASSWTTVQTITGNTSAGVLDYPVSGTGRYVRILGTLMGSYYGYSLWEMQVYGTSAATNLSAGRTVTASSFYTDPYTGATYPASYVVDGNGGTRWSSGFTNNEWISIDLGSVRTINDIKLNWGSGAHGVNYQLQVSNNASSWSTIQTVIGNTSAGVLDYPVSASGRYVRMIGTQMGTYYGYSLWEFEVFGN